jgi:hypothetical protein
MAQILVSNSSAVDFFPPSLRLNYKINGSLLTTPYLSAADIPDNHRTPQFDRNDPCEAGLGRSADSQLGLPFGWPQSIPGPLGWGCGDLEPHESVHHLDPGEIKELERTSLDALGKEKPFFQDS